MCDEEGCGVGEMRCDVDGRWMGGWGGAVLMISGGAVRVWA